MNFHITFWKRTDGVLSLFKLQLILSPLCIVEEKLSPTVHKRTIMSQALSLTYKLSHFLSQEWELNPITVHLFSQTGYIVDETRSCILFYSIVPFKFGQTSLHATWSECR